MKLNEFIAITLKQVIDGVVEAQQHAESKGALVNPAVRISRSTDGKFYQYENAIEPPHEINFDIAITTIEGKGTSGGVGIFVGPIGLGSKGESSSGSESLSRIQFSVPVYLPVQSILGD